MPTIEGRPLLYFIIYIIIGILHIFIPVWGIVVDEPVNSATFYWYWGFYFHATDGDTKTGTITDEGWLTAGRTAMTIIIICFIILLITVISGIHKKEKYIGLFGIISLIIGIILVIAPSIYVAEVSDYIFDDYSWGVGIYFSYFLAIVPIILGILFIYMKSKGEKVGD